MTETPGWMQRRSGPQWQRAHNILATARQATPEVVWAVGPFMLQHAHGIIEARAGRHPLCERGATLGPLGQVRSIHADRRIVTLATVGTRRAVLTVAVCDVYRLVAELPAELVAAVEAAVDERYAIGREAMARNERLMRGDHPPAAEMLAGGARYGANERRCQDVGADVWEHVKPAPAKPVQLGLFDLAGAS